VDVDGGWSGVAGAGLTEFLDSVTVVAAAFDCAGAGPVPSQRIDLAGNVGEDVG
jgi:hypothetical protein